MVLSSATCKQVIQQLNDQRDHAVALLSNPPITMYDYADWTQAVRLILVNSIGESDGRLRQFQPLTNSSSDLQSETPVIAKLLENNIVTIDSIVRQLEVTARSQTTPLLFQTNSAHRNETPSPAAQIDENDMTKIFLSYAHLDRPQVEQIYDALVNAGFKPWMDARDILPGEIWALAIQRAIRQADFFFAFLSHNSVNRRGWIQKELKTALDNWEEKLIDDIYLIPVRLEVCDAPETLSQLQWVDLYDPNGWAKLLAAIQVGVTRRQLQ